MKVLVLYGSTEGQTRRIAEFVCDRLSAFGHDVTLADAATDGANVDPRAFHAALIAAPILQGAYQPAVCDFARTHSATLNRMKTAFLSVSLWAASLDPTDIANAALCAEALANQTGWRPQLTLHVAGALRDAHDDFFKAWAGKLMAQHHGWVCGHERRLEFTDWIRLRNDVDAFASNASGSITALGDQLKRGTIEERHVVRGWNGNQAGLAQ